MRTRFYAATVWLCLLIAAVYGVQKLVPGFTERFLLRSANVPAQPWLLLTSIFLHASIAHLLLNLFALGLFGIFVEREIGTVRFLALFFVSGIAANVVAMYFYPASLGASGAIFGVAGMLGILQPGLPMWFTGFPLPMFVAIIAWAVANVFGLFMPGNVANAAHLGGLAVGALAGVYWRMRHPKPQKTKTPLNASEEKALDDFEREAGLRK